VEHFELFAGGSTRATWARIIEEHRGSGLSAAVFCRERSLAVSLFYGGRRSLKSPRAPSGFFEVKGVADSRGVRPFAGAAPEMIAGNVRSTGVRIELAVGRRVVVTRGFDRLLLTDVIEALDELAGLIDEMTGESGVMS